MDMTLLSSMEKHICGDLIQLSLHLCVILHLPLDVLEIERRLARN